MASAPSSPSRVLDQTLLARCLSEALLYEPFCEIVETAQEISRIFAGRNAEMVAIGFVAAGEYWKAINERKQRG